MLNKDTLIKVKNRNNGAVGYEVADLDVRRRFSPNEEKEIEFEELRLLSFVPGGEYMLNHYLYIDNKEAVQKLLGNVEPEYKYTDEDIKNLLLNGSVAELQDCLDFAPSGVVELVKKYAVDLKLNDIQKRKAIKDITGFDVTKAVEVNEETEDEKIVTNKSRRVAEPGANKENIKERRTAFEYTE